MSNSKIVMSALAISVAAFALATAASAGGLDALAGGGDLSSLASGSAGNAAGVIGYCVKNNYLGGDAATSMKDKLMGKAGLGSDSKDEGFSDGASGIVKTSGGKSVDLGKLGGGMGGMGDMKSKLTKKACAAVLDHAKSLL
jgi:hypothetical protein